jgi:type IX secretion system PorP/SprF family membrane protein
MKKHILAFILYLIQFYSFGQSALTNDYYFNYLAINPAFAGSNGSFATKGIFGNQLNGSLRPNQVSQTIVIEGQLYNKTGLAAQFFRSNAGGITSNGLNLSYSKGIEFNDFVFKAGVDGGILVLPVNVNNQSQNPINFISSYFGFGTVGIYKNIHLGASMPLILASKSVFEPKPIFIMAGYNFDKEKLITFNVNTVVSYFYENKKNFIDLNFKTWYNKRIALGFSYKNNSQVFSSLNSPALIPIIEYQFAKAIKLGLSYNSQPVSSLNSNNSSLRNLGLFQLMFLYNKQNVSTETSILGNL